MKINKKFFYDNLTTIFYALIIAIIIRSVLFQPFYIPSSSMEPTLLVGDRLFVSKYTYGYSKHSLPLSLPLIKNRIFSKKVENILPSNPVVTNPIIAKKRNTVIKPNPGISYGNVPSKGDAFLSKNFIN